MSDQIKIDLDPRKVIDGLQSISKESKDVAKDIEQSLGKDAPKHIKTLEDAAENGSAKIATYFRNLGERVRADLKTAFDATKILSGLNLAKDIGSGVKQVFEMERAFDKLNVRLHLTNKEMTAFKKEVGRRVASTGQKLEDVLPGVETAASRGGIKNTGQLADVAQALGMAKATTGEATDALSETVVETLKAQGMKVTGESFKAALDAIEGTRTSGAFKSANEAGQAMQQLAPYAKNMGLGTRELGGLAAMASKSGQSGQDILHQLMERASQPGQKQALNDMFEVELFKNGKGKLDASKIGNINTNKYGEYSQQILEQATGLHGASGADLVRFVDSFKNGMGQFDQVVHGANETAEQFSIATDNLASKIDRFKQHAMEAGREVGGSVSVFGKDLISGNISKLGRDALNIRSTAHENAGAIAGTAAVAGVAALLAGGGLNSLLSKLPGGGMAKGFLGAEAAKAAGITPVYMTNTSDITSKLGIGNGLGGAMPGGYNDKMAQAMGAGGNTLMGTAGKALQMAGAAAAGLEIGIMIGDAINQILGKYTGVDTMASAAGYTKENALSQGQNNAYRSMYSKDQGNYQGKHMEFDDYVRAHEQAIKNAEKSKPTSFTNPSSVNGRGKGH